MKKTITQIATSVAAVALFSHGALANDSSEHNVGHSAESSPWTGQLQSKKASPPRDYYVVLGQAFSDVDAGSGSDFDDTGSVTLTFGYTINDWVTAEVSYQRLFSSEDKGSDFVGSYRIETESDDWLIGATVFPFGRNKLGLYAKGGLMYWSVDLDAKETFVGLGVNQQIEASEEDDNLGYYVGLGYEFTLADQFHLGPEIGHRQRPDVFKGNTAKPFDLEQNYVSFNMRYSF